MAETRKLYRSRSNRQVAGVWRPGQVLQPGRHADPDPVRRAGRARGSGLLLYVAMWIIVPNEPSAAA